MTVEFPEIGFLGAQRGNSRKKILKSFLSTLCASTKTKGKRNKNRMQKPNQAEMASFSYLYLLHFKLEFTIPRTLLPAVKH